MFIAHGRENGFSELVGEYRIAADAAARSHREDAYRSLDVETPNLKALR